MKTALSFRNNKACSEGHSTGGRFIPLIATTLGRDGNWQAVWTFSDIEIDLRVYILIPFQKFIEKFIFMFFHLSFVIGVILEELFFVQLQKAIKFV